MASFGQGIGLVFKEPAFTQVPLGFPTLSSKVLSKSWAFAIRTPNETAEEPDRRCLDPEVPTGDWMQRGFGSRRRAPRFTRIHDLLLEGSQERTVLLQRQCCLFFSCFLPSRFKASFAL